MGNGCIHCAKLRRGLKDVIIYLSAKSAHMEFTFLWKTLILKHVKSLRYKLMEYHINSFEEGPMNISNEQRIGC